MPKHRAPETLKGRFEHLIYSPSGGLEGVLLTVADSPLQVVFEPSQPELFDGLGGVEPGQTLVVKATPQGPSKHGEPAHAVYDLVELVSIDGAPPSGSDGASASGYKGKVVRFNYARHGEPNGVVLDTGDFIHLKPAGFALFDLSVGDDVEAEGDAHRLVTDDGWAVEATIVNGYTFG